MGRRHPDWSRPGPRTTWREELASLPGSIEMVVLFGLVMGGLFAGFFTPSEAGAAGSALALGVSLAGGNLSWKKLRAAVDDTIRISCMILMIVAGAVIFGRFLAVTRLPFDAATWVGSLDLPAPAVILLIGLIYMLGGMVMDALALLLITIPIFFPMAEALGCDLIWFSAFVCVVTTMGAITPPVGVNVFIVASMAPEVSMERIFTGVAWFLPAFALLFAVMMLAPGLVTFLPGLVR